MEWWVSLPQAVLGTAAIVAFLWSSSSHPIRARLPLVAAVSCACILAFGLLTSIAQAHPATPCALYLWVSCLLLSVSGCCLVLRMFSMFFISRMTMESVQARGRGGDVGGDDLWYHKHSRILSLKNMLPAALVWIFCSLVQPTMILARHGLDPTFESAMPEAACAFSTQQAMFFPLALASLLTMGLNMRFVEFGNAWFIGREMTCVTVATLAMVSASVGIGLHDDVNSPYETSDFLPFQLVGMLSVVWVLTSLVWPFWRSLKPTFTSHSCEAAAKTLGLNELKRVLAVSATVVIAVVAAVVVVVVVVAVALLLLLFVVAAHCTVMPAHFS